MLNISIGQLLSKMENELHEARTSAESARMRERVHAIKMLCELILEEPESERKPSAPMIKTFAAQNVQQHQPINIQQTKPLKMDDDDDANGESLFDF